MGWGGPSESRDCDCAALKASLSQASHTTWREIAPALIREMAECSLIRAHSAPWSRLLTRKASTPWNQNITGPPLGRARSQFCSGRCPNTARLRLVARRLIAIIDDDEELCSSLVDLMRSIGHCARKHASPSNDLSILRP